MKKIQFTIYTMATLLLLSISSCDFIAGVFKGGVYVGVFLVIIVIAVILWLVNKGKSRE